MQEDKKRNHKVKNSYGTYDFYKYYRKTKPSSKEYILTEKQFSLILNTINNYLANLLKVGTNITLPTRCGNIEIRQYNSKIKLEGGKIKTNLAINWLATKELWADDEEARCNKTLIRHTTDKIYKIYYNKNKALFTNKSKLKFKPARAIQRALALNIKRGLIESFSF